MEIRSITWRLVLSHSEISGNKLVGGLASVASERSFTVPEPKCGSVSYCIKTFVRTQLVARHHFYGKGRNGGETVRALVFKRTRMDFVELSLRADAYRYIDWALQSIYLSSLFFSKSIAELRCLKRHGGTKSLLEERKMTLQLDMENARFNGLEQPIMPNSLAAKRRDQNKLAIVPHRVKGQKKLSTSALNRCKIQMISSSKSKYLPSMITYTIQDRIMDSVLSERFDIKPAKMFPCFFHNQTHFLNNFHIFFKFIVANLLASKNREREL